MAMQTCGRSAPTPSAPSLGALRHGNTMYRYMQEQSPITNSEFYIEESIFNPYYLFLGFEVGLPSFIG